MTRLFASPEAALTNVPCAACGQRALAQQPTASRPCATLCLACGAAADALPGLTVRRARVTRVGGCCAGFLCHSVDWEEAGEHAPRPTGFETWVQDHVLLRPGDVASLLFPAGELERRKGLPMPLVAVNHTLDVTWALPGACALERIGPPALRAG